MFPFLDLKAIFAMDKNWNRKAKMCILLFNCISYEWIMDELLKETVKIVVDTVDGKGLKVQKEATAYQRGW